MTDTLNELVELEEFEIIDSLSTKQSEIEVLLIRLNELEIQNAQLRSKISLKQKKKYIQTYVLPLLGLFNTDITLCFFRLLASHYNN